MREKVALSGIDAGIIVLYLAILVGVGLYFSRKRKIETAGDLFLGGRSLKWYNVGLSIFSSNVSPVMLVGYGGNPFAPLLTDAGWKDGAQPRRVLTFALDGTASLAPSAPPDRKLRPLDDPQYDVVEAELPDGHRLFAMNCALCHGTDAISGNAAALDLRS